MKAIYTLFFAASMLISCNKSITVSGRVYNANTLEGDADQPVWVFEKYKPGKPNDTIHLLTNGNGDFSTEIKDKRNPAFVKFPNFEQSEMYLLNTHERYLLNRGDMTSTDLPYLRRKGFTVFIEILDQGNINFSETAYIRINHELAPDFYNRPEPYFVDLGSGYHYISGLEGNTTVEVEYLNYHGTYLHQTKTIDVDYNSDHNEITFEL